MASGTEAGCIVAVFARAPVPGAVKTRLIPRLGAEGACALHRRLVDAALTMATGAGVGAVELWCAPGTDDPFFAQCAELHGVRLMTQSEGDIGARMHAAAAAVLQRAAAMILIGSDCPAMTAVDLRESAAALADGFDAVFLPVEDGGYTLVALTRPQPALFSGIDWSTARVMPQTREHLRALRLRWHELAPRWDLDRPEDLDRLEDGWWLKP